MYSADATKHMGMGQNRNEKKLLAFVCRITPLIEYE